PFYFPYLSGAKFNVSLHQEQWAALAPDGLPQPPFVLLYAIQTGTRAPVEPSPPMALTMRNLLHERANGELKTAFDVIPAHRAMPSFRATPSRLDHWPRRHARWLHRLTTPMGSSSRKSGLTPRCDCPPLRVVMTSPWLQSILLSRCWCSAWLVCCLSMRVCRQ